VSEGEHTIISKIPRERLNQIAGRKLSALAIPVRLGADRETLEGELPFARLAHPATGAAIPRARFAVVGHDSLRFTEAPLSALAPIPFYDLERQGALEQRVAEALQRRAGQLREQAALLRGLGLEVGADQDRLVARAVVKTPTHAFELLGGPEGVRVARVAPVGGKPFEVPPTFPGLRLAGFQTPTDVEIFLAHQVPELEAASRRPGAASATPVPASSRLEPTPPPRNALTLGQLARAFGEAGMLAPSAPVEIVQEFTCGGTHYRFVAVRDAGTLFKGRVIGPKGDVWAERFDLGHFPGTAQVMASALGVRPAELPVEAPAAGSSEPVPPHLLPSAGEVWVMNVVVEAQQAEEVRYVGTDIDGRPYGAARVLKRADFEAVFSSHRGGWRLLVVVDQVQGDAVLYRQLDPRRQPLGAPRRMATAVLVANFIPEAAAF